MPTDEPMARRFDPLALVAGLLFLAFALASLIGDVFDVWGIVSMLWPFALVGCGVLLVVTSTVRKDR